MSENIKAENTGMLPGHDGVDLTKVVRAKDRKGWTPGGTAGNGYLSGHILNVNGEEFINYEGAKKITDDLIAAAEEERRKREGSGEAR